MPEVFPRKRARSLGQESRAAVRALQEHHRQQLLPPHRRTSARTHVQMHLELLVHHSQRILVRKSTPVEQDQATGDSSVC